MTKSTAVEDTHRYYSVWDRTTRCFHWINVICIVGLASVGLVILNHKLLGVSDEGKILLKTLHVYIGYVFAVNLGWRLLWGFIGNKYARWNAILPLGKGYWRSVCDYLKSGLKANPSKESAPYLGHNPVARLMVSLLFLLLTIQAVTGLVLAGTDLYFPPFGGEIAQWVASAEQGSDKIARLIPGSMEGVDAQAYEQMRAFRKPFVTLHGYNFYVLIVAILLHVVAVVLTEIREKNALISAMFTGKKVLSTKPVDEE